MCHHPILNKNLGFPLYVLVTWSAKMSIVSISEMGNAALPGTEGRAHS